MADIDVTADNTLVVGHNMGYAKQKFAPMYGTLQDANDYASMHLYWDAWAFASEDDRLRALVTSARAIDRLNFQGCATGTSGLAFPRDSYVDVPRKVIEACYENAISIIRGLDPETEIRNLSAASQGFSGHTTRYDRTFIPLYLQHGIVSAAAWANLTPFLRDPRSLNLVRA